VRRSRIARAPDHPPGGRRAPRLRLPHHLLRCPWRPCPRRPCPRRALRRPLRPLPRARRPPRDGPTLWRDRCARRASGSRCRSLFSPRRSCSNVRGALSDSRVRPISRASFSAGRAAGCAISRRFTAPCPISTVSLARSPVKTGAHLSVAAAPCWSPGSPPHRTSLPGSSGRAASPCASCTSRSRARFALPRSRRRTRQRTRPSNRSPCPTTARTSRIELLSGYRRRAASLPPSTRRSISTGPSKGRGDRVLLC
jgi:hypothetical protein